MKQVKYSDATLKASAQRVANAFAKAYNEKHKLDIKLPVKIKCDLELKKPGVFAAASGRTLININMTVFRVAPDLFLNTIIPHEVAHLAQTCIDHAEGKASPAHGIRWMNLMKSMYQEPLEKLTAITPEVKRAFEDAKEVKKTKDLLMFQPEQAGLL